MDAGDQNLQSMSDDLLVRCKELLEWSRTGLLADGGAVRSLAKRLSAKIGENYALSVAENQTKDDALRFVVSHAALTSRAEQGAKRIQEQQAEIELLRLALQPFAKIPLWRDHYPDAKSDTLVARQMQGYVEVADIRRARAALSHEASK